MKLNEKEEIKAGKITPINSSTFYQIDGENLVICRPVLGAVCHLTKDEAMILFSDLKEIGFLEES